MPPTYEQNKSHIYKWRLSNGDRMRAINRKSKAKYDSWQKVKRQFLAILRDY